MPGGGPSFQTLAWRLPPGPEYRFSWCGLKPVRIRQFGSKTVASCLRHVHTWAPPAARLAPATSLRLYSPQEQLKRSHCATRLCPRGFCFPRVVAMHEARPSRPFEPFRRARPGAFAAMQPTAPIRHGRSPARSYASASLCSAARACIGDCKTRFPCGKKRFIAHFDYLPRCCAPPGSALSDRSPLGRRPRPSVSMPCWNVFIIRVTVPAKRQVSIFRRSMLHRQSVRMMLACFATYWYCSTTTRCSPPVRIRCKVSMPCWNVSYPRHVPAERQVSIFRRSMFCIVSRSGMMLAMLSMRR